MPFGFYGKLPCQGDFVTRRLPWEFTEIWDAWMQRSLLAAREQLGERWLEHYLSTPVWRFRLAAGLAGPQGWVGLWFPSVDRVGRHFPLTIATPVPADAGEPMLVADNDERWIDLEDQALKALDPYLPLAEFDALLLTLTDPFERTPDSSAAKIAEPSTVTVVRVLPEDTAPATAAKACAELPVSPALFFTWGSDRVPISLVSAGGLVETRVFSGFLTGEWPELGVGDGIGARMDS